MEPGTSLVLGDRTEIVSQNSAAVLGVAHRAALRCVMPGASIRLGDDVGMTGGTICAATSIEIGDETMLGADVTVVDTDFHPLSSRSRRREAVPEPRPTDAVRIGRNVFLGTRVIVLKGVTIGDDTVVGAGSVVTHDLPPGTICAGSPAEVVRTLDLP